MDTQTSLWKKNNTDLPYRGQRCWVRDESGTIYLAWFDEIWMMFRDESGDDLIRVSNTTHWAPAEPPEFKDEA